MYVTKYDSTSLILKNNYTLHNNGLISEENVIPPKKLVDTSFPSILKDITKLEQIQLEN